MKFVRILHLAVVIHLLIGSVVCNDGSLTGTPDAQQGANISLLSNNANFPGLKGETSGEDSPFNLMEENADLVSKIPDDEFNFKLYENNHTTVDEQFVELLNKFEHESVKSKLKAKDFAKTPKSTKISEKEFLKTSKAIDNDDLTFRHVFESVVNTTPNDEDSPKTSKTEDNDELKLKQIFESVINTTPANDADFPTISKTMDNDELKLKQIFDSVIHTTSTTGENFHTTSHTSSEDQPPGDVSYFESSFPSSSGDEFSSKTSTENIVENITTENVTSENDQMSSLITTPITRQNDVTFPMDDPNASQPVIVHRKRLEEIPLFVDAPYEALMTRAAKPQHVIFSNINITYKSAMDNEIIKVYCDPYPQFPTICDYFAIRPNFIEDNKWSGSLILQQELPSHSKAIYQVKLVAMTSSGNATTTITVIHNAQLEEEWKETILLKNRSDSENTSKSINSVKENLAPKFNSGNISFTISESLPPGAIIPGLHLSVSDDDLGTNAIFNITALDPSGLFIVEPTTIHQSANVSFRLNPLAKLDYEELDDKTVVFLVAAMNSSSDPPLSTMVMVSIEITDANDNYPIFDKQVYTAQIPENSPTGSPVVVVNATDVDTESFGTEGIRYTLQGSYSQFFQVDSISGVVSVADCILDKSTCLDYEKNKQMAFTVKATDDNGAGLSTSVPIVVDLLDVNDNSPKFDRKTYETEIKIGSSTFSPPLTVKATDDDASSIITYLIVDNSTDIFTVDSVTGRLSFSNSAISNLTDLIHHKIILTIEARDQDNYYDTATVNIIVEDDNNHIPIFESNEYIVNVSDAVTPNSFLTQVSASDVDIGSGGRVSYSIQQGNDGNFKIDPNSGIISVSDPHTLDYDKQNLYQMQVIAIDGGYPSKTGTTSLIVNIEDGNNKPPVFDNQVQRTYVKENAPLGTVVYKLSASDPDISSPEFLKYMTQDPVTVFDHNGNKINVFKKNRELFYVSDSSGEVKVASIISRNSIALVVMTITAIDTTTDPYQTGTATLLISIVGDTNHSPIFPPPWSPVNPNIQVQVIEESPINSFLLSLIPSDSESSQIYKIDPPSSYVKIEPTAGVLLTSSRIDYESIEQFSCVITATDATNPLLTISANVTVDIININDNKPHFSQSEYRFFLEEHSDEGTVVGNVSAIDEDKGQFGEISYSISGDLSDFFSVNKNGVITTTSAGLQLDRENIEECVLRIIASDDDPDMQSRQSMDVSVFITLTDINDNPPRFINPIYEAFVVPVKNAGNPVIQVVAADVDKGINGSVEYSIEDGNDDGLFWINGTTGIIYIGNKATNESGYSLKISARDQNGKGPHTDYATVLVHFSEINSHSPQFVIPYPNKTEVTINENKPADLLFQVKANDLDSGTNGVVTYDFVDNNKIGTNELEHFVIDVDSGQVRVKGPLDREEKDRYQLIIRAKDNGEPHSLESVRVITVRVLDENDNVPEFPKGAFFSPYSFSVYENELIRTTVGQVSAMDPDEGLNGKVFYSIIDGNEGDHFIIDSDSGIIRTNIVLDHEKKNSYNLLVKASNEMSTLDSIPIQKRSTSDNMGSTATVEIKVKNTNDNPPQFIGAPYRIGVKYSAEIGDFVTQVKAVDPDGDNVTYSLTSSHLFRSRAQSSSGAVVPQPFTIDRSGHIFTSASLVFYNQDRFHLTVVAREDTSPFKETKTTVEVWIYEQSQLLRVVVAFPPDIITQDISVFTEMLSNLTQGTVYIDDIRYHTNKDNEIDKHKTDIFIHVVDGGKYTIKSVPEVLDIVDNTFFYYPQFQQLHLTSVEPVYSQVTRETFSPALSTLIALLIVLFIGFIVIIIVCCTTQVWAKKKQTVPVRRKLVSSTTPTSAIENPLWIDKKLKPYEEQELSMHVFSDLLGQKTTRFHGSLGSASIVEAALNLEEEFSPIEEKPRNNKDFIENKGKKHKELKPQISETSLTSTSTFVFQGESPKSNGKSEKNLKFSPSGEPVMVGELL